MLLLLTLALATGLGAYAWWVAAALRETEQRIVVPLPAEPTATASAGAMIPPTLTPPSSPAGSFSGVLGAASGADPGLDPVWGGKRYLNVLVLGFDARDGETDPPRGDVFMLAQLDLVAKTLNVVSIPRDLWVTIPGYGEERINAAYPLGWRANQPAAGVALVKRTVEQNFGLPIDYYITVNFQGFRQTVDAVGGITVDVPYYLRDEAYPTEDYGVETVEFFPGSQRMDGKTALKYARTRHADSDYGRRQRQEQLLLALFDQGRSVGIVARLPAVLRSFGGTVQTNFTFDQQLALGRVALAMSRDNIGLYSVDETMTSGWFTPAGADVIRGDWPKIAALIAHAFVMPANTRLPAP